MGRLLLTIVSLSFFVALSSTQEVQPVSQCITENVDGVDDHESMQVYILNFAQSSLYMWNVASTTWAVEIATFII